jgi:hypothetical protein
MSAKYLSRQKFPQARRVFADNNTDQTDKTGWMGVPSGLLF